MKTIEDYFYLGLKLLILTYIIVVPIFWTVGLTTFHDGKSIVIQLMSIYLLFMSLGCLKYFRLKKIHIWILFYVFLSILSSINSINIFESYTVISLEVSAISVFIIVSGFKLKKEIIKWIIAITVVFLIVSLIGCYQKIMNDMLSSNSYFYKFISSMFGKWRYKDAVSTIGNRNFSGQYLVLPIFLIGLLAFSIKNIFYKSFMIFSFSIGFIYIIFTRCRSAWIGFLFIFILLIFNSRKFFIKKAKENSKLVIIVFFISLIFILTLFIYSGFINEFSTIFSFRFSSNQFRLLVWKSSLSMIKHHPLMGKGIGSFKFWYPLYRSKSEYRLSGTDSWVKKAHSEYIQILTERGIIGFSIFIIFIFLVLIKLWKYRNSNEMNINNRPVISSGIFYGLLSAFIMTSFSSNFTMATALAYSYLMMGIGLCYTETEDDILKISSTKLSNSKKYFFIPFFLLLIPIISPTIPVVKLYLGNFLYTWGSRMEQRRNYPKAKEEAYKAFNMSEKFLKCNIEEFFKKGKLIFELGDKLKRKAFELQMKLRKNRNYSKYERQSIQFKIKEYQRQAKENYKMSLIEYEKAIKLYPNFRNAYNNLGNVYKELGDVDNAVKCYKKGIKIGPEYALANCNLGVTYAMKNLNIKAEKEFKKALEQDPFFGAAYRNLGVLYIYKLKRIEDAIRCFEKYLLYSDPKTQPDREHIKAQLKNIISYAQNERNKLKNKYLKNFKQKK